VPSTATIDRASTRLDSTARDRCIRAAYPTVSAPGASNYVEEPIARRAGASLRWTAPPPTDTMALGWGPCA
jgi:hypothetical protein